MIEPNFYTTMRTKFKLIGIMLMVLMPWTAGAEKHLYYVSPKGNDNAAGTLARPFRTVQKALAAAGTHQPDKISEKLSGTKCLSCEIEL